MTTIAYRNGILAADTMVSYGSFRNGYVNKIRVLDMLRDGRTEKIMIAMSGTIWTLQPMIEWIENGAEQDDIPHRLLSHSNDFSCVMVTGDGQLYEFNEGYFIECGVQYHAIGSGAQFALGAMAVGVGAPEAVKAAMEHDKASGGEITVMAVSDLKIQEAA